MQLSHEDEASKRSDQDERQDGHPQERLADGAPLGEVAGNPESGRRLREPEYRHESENAVVEVEGRLAVVLKQATWRLEEGEEDRRDGLDDAARDQRHREPLRVAVCVRDQGQDPDDDDHELHLQRRGRSQEIKV